VESASNVEIRCQVQSQGTAGTRILKIIPEGTYVEKGQVLVELDSSSLENDLLKQQIAFSTSEAGLIQAQNDWETAQKTREEYEFGKYVIDKDTSQSEIDQAEEDYRRAQEYLDYSQKLAKKGYVTDMQLQADKFAFDKAESMRRAAKTKAKVLENFTKAKMLRQLEADIATSKAKLDAQKATHELDTAKLKLIKEQIAACTIKAPEPGQVVYANNTEYRGFGNEVIIEEGALVRERQVLIRLPDPKRMQVKAKVNESKIALVREGQPVAIHLDAFPEAALTGVVEKVNEYPAQSSWWSTSVKEYETTVKIVDSPVPLRPGLTAEVKIRVARESDAIQVPVTAVLEHASKTYCILPGETGWEVRDVKLGGTNEKFVVVREGLSPGETVALGAAALRDKVELPEAPLEPAGKPLLAGIAGAASALAGGPASKPGGQPPFGPPGANSPSDRKADEERDKRDAAKDEAAELARLFDAADRDHDGKLHRSDIPARFAALLATADTNHDQMIDRTEWVAALRGRVAVKPAPAGRPPADHGGGP
jgi:multidrug resistance efflux pump